MRCLCSYLTFELRTRAFSLFLHPNPFLRQFILVHNQILESSRASFWIYLQLYPWNSKAAVGLMDCNVPPSLHTALRLLSIPLPAVTPGRARSVECDRAAASSVLAARCISGEMNLLPCASLWHTVKVLLVFIWVLQYSRPIYAKISLFASGGRRAYANVDASSVR